jgi:hypothetical protein
MDTMSVREALMFAAQLKLPDSVSLAEKVSGHTCWAAHCGWYQ